MIVTKTKNRIVLALKELNSVVFFLSVKLLMSKDTDYKPFNPLICLIFGLNF